MLSVLEAKGSCLRKQLGQIMFHNCILNKVGVNSVSKALVLPCAKCPQWCCENGGWENARKPLSHQAVESWIHGISQAGRDTRIKLLVGSC